MEIDSSHHLNVFLWHPVLELQVTQSNFSSEAGSSMIVPEQWEAGGNKLQNPVKISPGGADEQYAHGTGDFLELLMLTSKLW